MRSKPKVAFIGTGGTIASIGKTPLDIVDYGANGVMLHAQEIIAKFPDVNEVAEVVSVPYRNVPSPQIYFPEWKELVLRCDAAVKEHSDLAGIVIGHGTASLEETAYALNLTAKVSVPVVVVGSQRPASALSTDAGLNLVNAMRAAAAPESRGRGVLVLLNDEIHSAREVTKTATMRMQTFRSPDFGVLGHADGDAIAYYRMPERKRAPDTEFDIRGLDSLPRVDVAYSYAGSDGTAIKAFTAAGAKGIVSAGFAPAFVTPGEFEALKDAVKAGVIVVQSTRAGSGRTFRGTRLRDAGILIADNLNPQKARILLAMALTRTKEVAEIERIFRTY
jgi:L-asparaginase